MAARIRGSGFIARGGWWVVGQFLLLLGIVWAGLSEGHRLQFPFCKLCGVILLIAAACVGAAGTWALGRGLTPLPSPGANARLVREGIYRHVRHPLYSAVLSGCLGWALVRESWLALALSVLLAGFLYFKSIREEAWLRARFAEYAEYEKSVKRFVPGVW